MAFPSAPKKKKSCFGFLIKWALYSFILILIYQYATDSSFRESVNDGITGFISRTGAYFSSLNEKNGPDFSLKGLWAAVSGGNEDTEPFSLTGSVFSGNSDTKPSPTKKPSPTRKPGSTGTTSSSYCGTRDQLVSKLKEQSQNKPDSIRLELSSLMYTMTDNADWVTEIIYDAGFSSASWQRQHIGGRNHIVFSEIKYSDAVPCTTLAQFETALKGAKETKTVSVRPSSALYEQLKENDWALIYLTEGKLGITSGKFSYYNEPYRVIEFTNLVFEPNFHRVTSLDQAKQCIYESSKRGDTTIALYCDDMILYRTLADVNPFWETNYASIITENCGINNNHICCSVHKQLIYSDNLEYSPGARIVMLAKTGRLNQLTPRERALYNRAMLIANRCKSVSSDDFELVMNICTELAASSQYQYCETDPCQDGCDRDNAYGVLMMGGGECDSYTDAFYLVANLAGLNVGYQLGDTKDEYSDMTSDSSHIWNTVTLNGNTYFLDMTWADSDTDHWPLSPYWILMGRDLAEHSHVWHDLTALKPIASATNRKYFPYYRNNAAFGTVIDAQEYLRNQKRSGKNYAQLMLINSGSLSNEDFLQQVFTDFYLGGSYSYRIVDKYIFLNFAY